MMLLERTIQGFSSERTARIEKLRGVVQEAQENNWRLISLKRADAEWLLQQVSGEAVSECPTTER